MSTVPLQVQLTTQTFCYYLFRLQSRKPKEKLAEHVYFKINKEKMACFTLEQQFSQESNNQFVVYRRQYFKEKPTRSERKKTRQHCTKTASLKASDIELKRLLRTDLKV